MCPATIHLTQGLLSSLTNKHNQLWTLTSESFGKSFQLLLRWGRIQVRGEGSFSLGTPPPSPPGRSWTSPKNSAGMELLFSYAATMHEYRPDTKSALYQLCWGCCSLSFPRQVILLNQAAHCSCTGRLQYRRNILQVPKIILVRSEKFCLNPERVTDRLMLDGAQINQRNNDKGKPAVLCYWKSEGLDKVE